MKSSVAGGNRASSPLEAKMRLRVEEWRDLLGACVRDASRKRVHELRSATLRLEAGLSYSASRAFNDPPMERAVARWTRAGKKLRRALRPVRDADVYLARLSELAAPRNALSRRARREVEMLESGLKQRRMAAESGLKDALEAHRKKWNQRGKEVESALAATEPGDGPTPAKAAFDHFVVLGERFQSLDRSNLHAFRKELKHALYLTELARRDPDARWLGAAFRMIHDSAGEWHDWQALATEAAGMLGGKAKPVGLIPVLEAKAEDALREALEQCAIVEGRLLKRKPVRRAELGADVDERRGTGLSIVA